MTTEEKIRLRAHAIYINRIAHPRLLPGAYHILGTAESDWLQAEREIMPASRDAKPVSGGW